MEEIFKSLDLIAIYIRQQDEINRKAIEVLGVYKARLDEMENKLRVIEKQFNNLGHLNKGGSHAIN